MRSDLQQVVLLPTDPRCLHNLHCADFQRLPAEEVFVIAHLDKQHEFCFLPEGEQVLEGVTVDAMGVARCAVRRVQIDDPVVGVGIHGRAPDAHVRTVIW